MNRLGFKKNKEKSKAQDLSRDLKRGEFKSILIDGFSTELPDFVFSLYKNSTYYFERIRSVNGHSLFETFHILFSLKEGNISCSVSSCINPTYRHSASYGRGLVASHTDLIVIKNKTGVLPVEDAYYFHNGKVETTKNIVQEIINDFKIYGVKYFEDRYKSLNESIILRQGLEYIENLDTDKKSLQASLQNERKECDWNYSLIENETFVELAGIIKNIPKVSNEDLEYIYQHTYSLLEYYFEN